MPGKPLNRAIKVRIVTHATSGKSGPCSTCKNNALNARQGKGFKLPPCHPNCKCKDNLSSSL